MIHLKRSIHSPVKKRFRTDILIEEQVKSVTLSNIFKYFNKTDSILY